MKKSIFLLAAFLLAANFLTAQIINNDPVIVLPPACEDPAVVALDISQSNLADGRVRIIVDVTVKNIGGSAFLSNPGQQALYLYRNGTLVANWAWEDLAKGASFTRRFTFTVRRTTAAQTYSLKAQISYDPDIFLDANPNNDDCKSDDNSKTKSVTI